MLEDRKVVSRPVQAKTGFTPTLRSRHERAFGSGRSVRAALRFEKGGKGVGTTGASPKVWGDGSKKFVRNVGTTWGYVGVCRGLERMREVRKRGMSAGREGLSYYQA